MQELFSLINGLSQDEQDEIILSFNKPFNTREEESSLLEKLFRHIALKKKKQIPDKELSLILYKTSKQDALLKLKSRLFQFILEVLISDGILIRENLFDPGDRQVLRVRKKMLQFRALYRKKNPTDFSVTYHLLNEVIKEAKKIEQYDILVEALYYKKYMLMLRKGFDEVREIKEQIQHYEYAYKALLKTNDHYFELVTNQDLIQKIKPAEAGEMLRTSILEIKEFIKVTDSPLMKHVCNMLQLEELLRAGRHRETIDVCMDTIGIMNKHRHLYRADRMGFIYDNISMCQVYREEYASAVLSAQKAQKCYSKNTINYLFSKQQEFYARFYSGEFKEANEIVNDLLDFPLINSGEYRFDKFQFLKACVLFNRKDYKEALTICNKTLAITKDKGRWDVGMRYVRLMCMMELQQYDQSVHGIESLRKMISRDCKQMISSRDEQIYKALNEFAFNGFSKQSSRKLDAVLKSLSATSGENAWNYYTHELIPVHEWIRSKLGPKAAGSRK